MYAVCLSYRNYSIFYIPQADFPRYSVGDTVSVTTDEDKLAIMISKQKDFGEYYSMVSVIKVWRQTLVGTIKISVQSQLFHE